MAAGLIRRWFCCPACRDRYRLALALAEREQERRGERPCDHCGAVFTPALSARYCSRRCSVAAWRKERGAA